MRPRAWSILAAAPATSRRSCSSASRDAEVVGVDGSAAMLEKARVTVPLAVRAGRLLSVAAAEPLDLIYSNAALQWVDRHPTLFPQLLSFLAPGGVLAVQMPECTTRLCG